MDIGQEGGKAVLANQTRRGLGFDGIGEYFESPVCCAE